MGLFKRKRSEYSESVLSLAAADSSQSSLADDGNELAPLIALLGCQATRLYAQGSILVSVEKANGVDSGYEMSMAAVRGNSLVLKNVSLDLLEATVRLAAEHLSLLISSSNKVAYHLKFESLVELQHWNAAIQLANYEYFRLNEMYTASLLSAKATQLSDVHVVMSELKFNKEEWVNMKFNKNSQWLRCYAVITPGTHKNKGTMNFYSSARTLKRNLICSITDVDYCHAVYPFRPELIDQSSLFKISGDIQIYQLGSTDQSTPPQSPRGHARTTSIGSVASTGSIKSKKGVHVHQSALYVMPLAHGGVKPYETMMRMLIPTYDCFKLYGRPARLVADKRDPRSLLFGLPSLPRVKILSSKVVQNLVRDNWDVISTSEQVDYNELLSLQLKSIYESDPQYQGHGNLKSSMDRSSTYEHPFARRDSDASSSPRYTMSISDLPLGLSQEAVDQISTTKFQEHTHVRSGSSVSTQQMSSLRTESYKNLGAMVESMSVA